MESNSVNSNKFTRYYLFFLISTDLIVINTSFYLVNILLLNSKLDFAFYSHLILITFIWILLSFTLDTYEILRIERFEKAISKLVKHISLHFTLLVLITLTQQKSVFDLQFISISVTVYACTLFLLRFIFKKVLKYYRNKGKNIKKIIVIGSELSTQNLNQFVQENKGLGYEIISFFNGDQVNEDVPKFISHNHVDEIFISSEGINNQIIFDSIKLAEKNLIRIKIIPEFTNYTKSRNVNIEMYGNVPILTLRNEPLEDPLNRLIKKLFDIFFSLFVIVFVFSWLFPIIAIIIKLESGGPVFFVQKRTGENNNSFKCFKFRTMKVNKNSDTQQATKFDARITKFGSIMRKTSIDELPQFFNVLFGSMSVVGPRPHMLKHTEEYSELINNYLVRHLAKPGITGWAQVNGYRGETKELIDMKKRVLYDIWYIENWSFLLDLRIIIQTITNIFKGEKNAY